MSKPPDFDITVVGTGAGNARWLGGEGVAKIKHPITAAPVVEGEHGRAWLCDLANGRKIMKVDPAKDAGLVHWVIEAPWAHPVWHSFSILLMHLRPISGLPGPLIYLDDATHEMVVHAMNPDADRNELLVSGIVRDHWLSPTNFAGQFIEIEDHLAEERVRAAVQKICDGRLSPDTDHQSDWERLFGSHMIKDRPNARPPVIRE